MTRYSLLLPGVEIVIGPSEEPFNRSAARNTAFAGSHGDVLLIADADTIFHADQILAAVEMVQKERTWVIPYAWYYNLSEEVTDNILELDPGETILEPANPSLWEHKIVSWAGLLVMPREAFEEVGGYDERFEGWGFEDNAFRLALDTLWAPHQRIDWGYCLHLWHPVTKHDRFEQPQIETNRGLYMRYEAAHRDPARMRLVLP
jgi:predicted glycosyltransferase involved in capsule biosynthesis